MDSFKQIEIDRRATLERTAGYLISGRIDHDEHDRRVVLINEAHDRFRRELEQKRQWKRQDQEEKAEMKRQREELVAQRAARRIREQMRWERMA